MTAILLETLLRVYNIPALATTANKRFTDELAKLNLMTPHRDYDYPAITDKGRTLIEDILKYVNERAEARPVIENPEVLPKKEVIEIEQDWHEEEGKWVSDGWFIKDRIVPVENSSRIIVTDTDKHGHPTKGTLEMDFTPEVLPEGVLPEGGYKKYGDKVVIVLKNPLEERFKQIESDISLLKNEFLKLNSETTR